MAGANVTGLTEFLKKHDKAVSDFMGDNLIEAGGFLGGLHTMMSSNGTVHKYNNRTSAPVVGFRAIGSGGDNAPGATTQVTLNLKLLDATAREDRAAAEEWEGGVEAFMEMKSAEYLQTGLHTIEKQFIYGVNEDAGGFVGLSDHTAFDALADPQVVDGGGAGNDVQSIWIVRTAPNALALITPGRFEVGDIYEADLYDSNQKPYAGYVAPLMSWFGLQFGSALDVVRVANVEKNSATIEDSIREGLLKFPADRMASYIVMSRTLRNTLRLDREAATSLRYDLPTEVDGVPIRISEALTDETAIA